MRNRIFGLIGVLWGGAVVAYKFLGNPPQARLGSGFATGQTIGFVLGALMFLVGAYYLVKKPSPE